MDIIFEPEISLEKSLILFANYFQFDFGIRHGLMHSEEFLGRIVRGPAIGDRFKPVQERYN